MSGAVLPIVAHILRDEVSMVSQKQQRALILSEEDRSKLNEVVTSRTNPAHHIERASVLLSCAEGLPVSKIANELGVHRSKIYRVLSRVSIVGAEKALDDLPRSGRAPTITPEATVWLLSLACQAPKDLGYSYERWTTDLLAQQAREHCMGAGHPSLSKLAQGTVVKILNKYEIKPHKVKYYLEVRDPDFDKKMVEVLKVYKLAELMVLKQELATRMNQQDAYSYEIGRPF